MSEVVDISPETLIPACASSSPAFCMMYSAYKLNKQSDNIQVLTYSFPNLEPVHCSMSGSNCCFLTCIQVSQEMEQQTGSKLGKEYDKAVYCHPIYLTYMLSTSCEMAGWMNHKWESRLQEIYQQPQTCR